MPLVVSEGRQAARTISNRLGTSGRRPKPRSDAGEQVYIDCGGPAEGLPRRTQRLCEAPTESLADRTAPQMGLHGGALAARQLAIDVVAESRENLAATQSSDLAFGFRKGRLAHSDLLEQPEPRAVKSTLEGRKLELEGERGLLAREPLDVAQQEYFGIRRRERRDGAGEQIGFLGARELTLGIPGAPARCDAELDQAAFRSVRGSDPPQGLTGEIASDREEPGPDRCALGAMIGGGAQGREKRLLGDIVRGRVVAGDRPREAMHARGVTPRELAERLGLPARGAREEGYVRGFAIGHVDRPKTVYSGQLPSSPVTSGTTPT